MNISKQPFPPPVSQRPSWWHCTELGAIPSIIVSDGAESFRTVGGNDLVDDWIWSEALISIVIFMVCSSSSSSISTRASLARNGNPIKDILLCSVWFRITLCWKDWIWSFEICHAVSRSGMAHLTLLWEYECPVVPVDIRRRHTCAINFPVFLWPINSLLE